MHAPLAPSDPGVASGAVDPSIKILIDGAPVDVPSAGPLRPAVLRSILPGRDYDPGETPAALRHFFREQDQEALLIRLLFASRRLANEAVTDGCCAWQRCMICGACAKAGDARKHRRDCPVQNVFDILGDLEEIAAQRMAERLPAPQGGAR